MKNKRNNNVEGKTHAVDKSLTLEQDKAEINEQTTKEIKKQAVQRASTRARSARWDLGVNGK